MAGGGRLSPGDLGEAPGTLAINGTLTLNSGAQLDYNFGQAGIEGGAFNDLVRVGGDLVLEGTLNVTQSAGGTFGPGLYRIISYGGALSGSGLGLGTVPAGTFHVQTAIANQVNLVNATGQAVSFWDGPDGSLNDGNIHGGAGVWRLSDNEYWTEQTGTANAPYLNGTFAVFAGEAGTVSVDNSEGAVEASGMQFAVDGYVIDGEPLTLVGGSSLIRVGDGTEDGAGMTATIDAVLAGGSTLVKGDLGTLVLSGTNTYTGGTTIDEGTLQVSADENLGDASGALTLDGGTLQTTADMESDRTVALSSTGTFLTDAGTTLTLRGALSGNGGFTKAGEGTLILSGTSAYDGAADIEEGVLRAGAADVFSNTSAFSVADGGELDLAGFSQTVGSLTNAGTVRFGTAPGTTLTVAGDYTGDGGTILFNTVLGGDSAASDRLVVNGDTAGDTTIGVANIGGGGEQTKDGIKIIDVAGASDGAFSLDGDYVFEGEQAVVAGAYAYRLYKGGVSTPNDGDWYLRSSLTDPEEPGEPGEPGGPGQPHYQAGVPLYEAYAGALQAFSEFGTLQQRLGNRSWAPGMGEAGSAGGPALWARIDGLGSSFEPDFSTSKTAYDVSTWKLEAGTDMLLSENAAGMLVGGITAHYGTVSSDVSSIHGSGEISATGYGLGATLTWFADNGLYVDGQTQVTWFDSDLISTTAGRVLANGNDGIGYGISLEAGKRIALNDRWSMTPQAQLAWSSVEFDSFTDSFGAGVSLDESTSLMARLGITLDRATSWLDAEGRTNRSHVYGIANLYHDFADGSTVDVGGTSFTSENDAVWGGIGVGGSLDFADDKYSVYGEALAKTSLENFGDSHAISGSVGVRVRW